jgi:hypothetical protein
MLELKNAGIRSLSAAKFIPSRPATSSQQA